MSKIKDLIKEHFGDGNTFSVYDFEKITGIDSKISAMNLKRLYDNCRIGKEARGRYYYMTDEAINKKVDKVNAEIDKYKLNIKKLTHV